MIVFDESMVAEELRGPLLAWLDTQIVAAVEAEREACARLADERDDGDGRGDCIAAAIRARGQT